MPAEQRMHDEKKKKNSLSTGKEVGFTGLFQLVQQIIAFAGYLRPFKISPEHLALLFIYYFPIQPAPYTNTGLLVEWSADFDTCTSI